MILRSYSGTPEPLGLSVQGDLVNFALFSTHASQVTLSLFFSEKDHPENEFPFERTGDVWHIALKGLPAEFDYSFRCDGPHNPKEGLLFNPALLLSDPYSRYLSKGQTRTKAILHPKPFDWRGDKPPQIPLQDLVIYEMHVRGFTKHPSSQVSNPGTYLGMIEKIPHLKKLGVNAVELMPIFEFDPTHCKNIQPKTGLHLTDYWGYNPLHFFVPHRGYASSPSAEIPVQEFKQLVRELHKNGIEVILDVVFNHTGEEKDPNYYVNFRGLDNSTYYTLKAEGTYRDDTGCGNTVNCNHPFVQKLILDSLRFWIQEMHIDGFRFDLASILTRNSQGKFLPHPPILQAIAQDPLIQKVKLIAEPWDAAGFYQVGAFPQWGPWSEWNDKYRDTVRKFIKGTSHQAGHFATALCGSEATYHASHTPLSSVNFITAHDGFSLRDLVSYQEKHNYENGEMNHDGSPQNNNWNCGAEGPTDDPKILSLRERQMRNFLLALFVSQGIPMLLMGDEYGHTRHGNNNPYVQDNEINWFLWDELEKNHNLFRFTASLIAFRKQQPLLRHTHFLTDSQVEWHNSWTQASRFIAYTLKPNLYIAFNANFQPTTLTLPSGTFPPGKWNLLIDTNEDWKTHFDKPKALSQSFEMAPYSALLAEKEH